MPMQHNFPSHSVEVRPYQSTDEASVVRLWADCGLTRSWNDPKRDIARKLTVQPELFLVGLHDASIIATAMAGYDGHRGWVNYLAVSPDYRRRGYGRLLMERIETELKSMGCPKLNIQVRATNSDVLRFYERLGYTVDQTVSLGKRLLKDD